MQSLKWYARRLSSMSPAEIVWRCRGQMQNLVDRALLKYRAAQPLLEAIVKPGQRLLPIEGTVLAATATEREKVPIAPYPDDWKKNLLARANAVCHGRLTFFGRDFDYGGVMRWNYEPEADKATPQGPAAAIDYRDHDIAGDCKLAWEPNRHQHLPLLGRAWRLTRNNDYADTALAHLSSWIDQCPFGHGMNWRSPLELGIRAINWIYTLELLHECASLTPKLTERIAFSTYQHVAEIARHYSRYSSANNHLVGEAAGVFIACSYFPCFNRSDRWIADSRQILETEILEQTHQDGGTREQATGYHLFVLEFFALAKSVAERTGRHFSSQFNNRLERMFDFLARLTEFGPLPMLGDADDGFVVDLGGQSDRVNALLRIGAQWFNRPDWNRGSEAAGEPAWWLLGSTNSTTSRQTPALSAHRSQSLDASGLYLLQHDTGDPKTRISAVVDGGEHGFGAIAAHGHADALSLVLRVAGQDVLVDPGTFDYFTHPAWREYFRSTRAHNTIVVDQCDQSEMLGPFLWGRRATTRLVQWEPRSDGGRFVAEHDGYTCLDNPVIHRRTVELSGDSGTVSICDELETSGKHEVTQCWHFAESCKVQVVSDHELRVTIGDGYVTLRLDQRLSVQLHHGSESPIAGWVSRGYHRKVPSYTVEASCSISGHTKLNTTMTLRSSRPQNGIDRILRPERPSVVAAQVSNTATRGSARTV